MKRISEIKDLLSKVYFSEEEKEYVVAFLEEIGVKGANSLVITENNLRDKLIRDLKDDQLTSRRVIEAYNFYEECIGHKIGKAFTINTATLMAIEEYQYQVQELKKKENGQEEQIKNDKGNLFTLLMISLNTEASISDVLKAIDKNDAVIAEEIRLTLKRALAG